MTLIAGPALPQADQASGISCAPHVDTGWRSSTLGQ